MAHRIALKDLVDLLPPTRDSARFRYFEPWSDTPFDPVQRTLTLCQAGWLMEAALLAYSLPHQALPVFARFRPRPVRVEFFENDRHDVECYLVVTRDAVLAVFRGSRRSACPPGGS